MLGYQVETFVTKQAGASFTEWAAPSLNCAELRRLAVFNDSAGKVTDTSELVADSVVPGASDDSFFEIPAGFQEVTFSGCYLLETQFRNAPADPRVLAGLRHMEDSYSTNPARSLRSPPN